MGGIMVVAGDVSGDQHSAGIVEALKRREEGLSFFGMGGAALAGAGVDLVADLSRGSVVGFAEVVRILPNVLRAYFCLRRLLRERRPEVLLLVDYPDMNLVLASQARRLGIAVCYYSPPQVWAWRVGRTRRLSRDVDLTLCLFGFEEKFLRERGVEARFVGHPLVDALPSSPTASMRLEARRRLDLSPDVTVVALLPGSRRSELSHHSAIFMEACQILGKQKPVQSVLAVAPGLEEGPLRREARKLGLELVVAERAREALIAADVAITKAGTSTLEAALCATPMVIGYKLARSSWWLARRLVQSPHVGMANLLAGRRVFPELLQNQLRPERIAEECVRMLETPPSAVVYEEIRRSLGAPGSQDRAAEMILERFF